MRHLPLVASTLDPSKPDAVAEETELELTLEGEELYNSVTFCGDEPLQAARDTLRDLADRYLP